VRRAVRRRTDTALARGVQRSQIAAQQRADVEGEPGEHAAVQASVGVRDDRHVRAVRQFEPSDGAVLDAVHEVLAHAIAAVGAQLLVQVHAGRRRGDFDNELGRAFELAVRGGPAAAASVRRQAQQQVGPRFEGLRANAWQRAALRRRVPFRLPGCGSLSVQRTGTNHARSARARRMIAAGRRARIRRGRTP